MTVKRQRRTPQDFHALAAKLDYKWLGPPVKLTADKTRWKCDRGHEFEASYNHMRQAHQRGYTCRACYLEQFEPGPDDFEALAQKAGLVFIGPAPDINSKTAPAAWQCEQGHELSLSYDQVRAGNRCAQCGHEKRAAVMRQKYGYGPDDYHELAQAQGLRWLGRDVGNVRQKTMWICDQGHAFELSYRKLVERENGCAICAELGGYLHPSKRTSTTPKIAELQGRLGELIQEFVAIKQDSWRPATLRGYEQALAAFADFLGDKWPVSHVDIVRFLNDPSASRRTVTKRSYFTNIRTFFNYLEMAEHIEPGKGNPATMVKRMRLLKKADDLPPIALSVVQMEKVLAYLEQATKDTNEAQLAIAWRDFAAVSFAYGTGCRQGEIVSLNVGDLDLNQQSAIIRKSKSAKYRVVYFEARYKQILEDYLAFRGNLSTLTNDTPLFPALGTRGRAERLKPGGLGQLWRRTLKAVGVKHCKFHALRHTFATHATTWLPINHLQHQLGHSDISTTMKYLRARDEDRARFFRGEATYQLKPQAAAAYMGAR